LLPGFSFPLRFFQNFSLEKASLYLKEKTAALAGFSKINFTGPKVSQAKGLYHRILKLALMLISDPDDSAGRHIKRNI
jgi:hypothetical protein